MTRALRHPIAWLDESLGPHKKRRMLVAAGVLLVTAVAYATLGLAAAGGHGDRILAVELAGDGRQVWEGSSFWHALIWDLPFIGAYVACAVVGARALMPFYRVRLLRTKGATLVTSIAVAAGGLDLVEDLFLAIGAAGDSRTGPNEPFVLAAVFAISKFVVLAAVVALLAVAFVSGCSLRGWLFAAMYAEGTGTDSEDLQQGIGKEALKGFRPGVGICLSGGGVRAASLTLGCLQQLERNPDGTLDPSLGWTNDKKITAVSGGAYMAGAWQLGRAYHPAAWRDEGPDGEVSPEEKHLLSNLGYLASTWSRGHRDEIGAPSAPSESDAIVDRLRSGASVWATVFVGFVGNLMVIFSALLLLVVVVTTSLDWLAGLSGSCDLQEKAVFTDPCVVTQPRFWLPSVLWLLLGALGAALWVLVSKTRALRRRVGVLKGFKGATRGALALSLVLAVLLVGFPFLAQVVHRWDGRSAIGMVAGLSGTLGSLVRLLVKRSAPLAAKLGGVAFAVLLVLMSGWLAVRVLEFSNRPTNGWFWLMVGAAVLVLVVAWYVGPELWSLNAFYRGKLRIAYAARRLTADEKAVSYVNDADASLIMWTPPADLDEPLSSGSVAAVAEPALHHLKGHTPLTICAAAHVTTRGVASHYGIPAMSFTFSPDKVRTYVPQDDEGHYQVIHCATEDLQASYKGAGKLTSSRVTTMFAVALAGAAVSPAMGRFRIGPTSALITFGNARLGAWLPNPRYVRPGAARRVDKNDQFPKVRLSYLVKEFCGIHDPSDPYVYVSDGGHWENTGLVELLRENMPREVVAVDADPGNPGSVHQLSSAIDLARLECGVQVHIDLDPVRGFANEPGGPVFAQRSVALGVMRRGHDWGLLWYSKPVLSRDAPTPLLAHREIDAEFPHTSTVDQFFDTSTYVAYRDLGRFNARELKAGRGALRQALGDSGQSVPAAPPDNSAAGAWAVRDFRRLVKDLPGAEEELVTAARIALGLDEQPATRVTERLASMNADAQSADT